MALKWKKWSKAEFVHSSLHSLSRLIERRLTVCLGTKKQLGTLRIHKTTLGEVSPSAQHEVLLEADCQSGWGCPGSHHTQRGG